MPPGQRSEAMLIPRSMGSWRWGGANHETGGGEGMERILMGEMGEADR